MFCQRRLMAESESVRRRGDMWAVFRHVRPTSRYFPHVRGMTCTYSVNAEWTPTRSDRSGQEIVAWKRRKERIAPRGVCTEIQHMPTPPQTVSTKAFEPRADSAYLMAE